MRVVKRTKIGKEFQVARIMTDTTLAEQAKVLGVSTSHMGNYEKGIAPFPVKHINKLIDFYTKKGHTFNKDFYVLACLNNQEVPINGLNEQHQELVIYTAMNEKLKAAFNDKVVNYDKIKDILFDIVNKLVVGGKL